MELRHLRYFCAVAERQSLSAAAQQLRVAQPSLSRQIRDLENEVGAKLLERSSRGVQATPAGLLFLQHARKILAQVSLAATAAAELARADAAEFVVGGDWRLPVDLVPGAVRQLRERFPRAAISLMELPMHSQLEALHKRTIHVGFVPSHLMNGDGGLQSRCIVHSAVDVVLPQTHPLAKRRQLRVAELAREQWVLIDEKVIPGARALYRRALKPHGFVPRFGPTAQSLDGVMARVAAGDGITLMPRIMVGKTGSLRVLATDASPMELHAVWPAEQASPLVPPLLEIIEGLIAP